MGKREREEYETKTDKKRGSRPVVSHKADTCIMTHIGSVNRRRTKATFSYCTPLCSYSDFVLKKGNTI